MALAAGPAAAALVVEPAVADSAAIVNWSDQPRFVMLRSLVVPGWGQWHNGSWIKAVAVAGGEGALAAGIVSDERALRRLAPRVTPEESVRDHAAYVEAVNEYNARLERRVNRQWLFAGVLVYALLDAYVDANFRGFDVEFRHDPALPDGTPTAPPRKGRASAMSGARVALRWHF